MLLHNISNVIGGIGSAAAGRKVRGVLIALMAVFVLPFVAFVGSAHAGTPTCANNYVCLWEHADYNGAKASVLSYGGGCHSIPASMNDKASSLANRSGYTVVFHVNGNCTSPFWGWGLGHGENTPNLSGTGLNDLISAFRVCNPAISCS